MKPKVVAFVPIKLNSERLPNKNILTLGSHPLCYYIFDTLLKINEIDEVFVYCSNENIKKYIPNGVKFLKRSESLDLNETKGMEIYKSFAGEIESDIYILAHATSPFTTSLSISESLKKVISEEYDSAFSVERFQTFAWYNGNPLNYKLEDIPRTQDIEPVYVETSSFFIFRNKLVEYFTRRIGFNPYLKEVSKIEAVDIDTEEDFEFAKILVNYHKIK